MTRRRTAALLASTASILALAAGLAAPATSAAPAPTDAVTLAYYAQTPEVPQAKSAAGMRRFLSTPQPGFDLQSYPLYGSLIDDQARTWAFSTMMQQTNHVTTPIGPMSYAVEGTMWGRGHGYTAGGVQGVPELTLPLTMTSRPWSIRAQAFTPGTAPQFVDMRVVSGRIGEKDAVYEVTADLQAGRLSGGPAMATTVYVRATDTLGLAQWGYGPSGFSPQWILPAQRARIQKSYHGSVEDYLAATGDPMTGQGSYYYTTPLLRVDDFSIVRGGRPVAHGHGGWLLMDAVTQSYGPKGEALVKDHVTWLEFSTQLPGSGQALKIGRVHQASVGSLPYASLASAATGHLVNGAVATSKWGIDDIHIAPIAGHRWTSPATRETYDLAYRVRLDPRTPGEPASELVYRAVHADQEVAFHGGRAVYEGLFTVTGTLLGRHVSGQAWAEIQPAGSLS